MLIMWGWLASLRRQELRHPSPIFVVGRYGSAAGCRDYFVAVERKNGKVGAFSGLAAMNRGTYGLCGIGHHKDLIRGAEFAHTVQIGWLSIKIGCNDCLRKPSSARGHG